jgi:hypothetical protein
MDVSRALGISAVTVSKKVSLRVNYLGFAKIQKQIRGS